MKKSDKKQFNATYSIALTFLMAIVVGSILLYLPFSQTGEYPIHYIDALFTATTSVCVTGLVVVPTFSAWSTIGQIIILILVEIGGLGVMTFMVIFLIFLRQRLGIKERVLIQTAYNLNRGENIRPLVKKTLFGTLMVQAIGALLYMFVFIPEFGVKGIWISIFNAVSAFCNAGMDIIGENSLIPYQTNVFINFVTTALIMMGGIGFPVWWFTIEKIRNMKNKKRLYVPIFVRIAVYTTLALMFGGGFIILLLEYNNPATIGNLPFLQKVMASIFQSVTTRTAGFCTIAQEGLRASTCIVCCVMMFIGGSPSGTAGGVKTTTIVILLATVISIMKERNDTIIYKRKINSGVVRQALAICVVSICVGIVAFTLLMAVQPIPMEDALYEVVSAIGTVGLTRALTPSLNGFGKLIIIIAMYLGRIGPITLSIFFGKERLANKLQYAEETVSVG